MEIKRFIALGFCLLSLAVFGDELRVSKVELLSLTEETAELKIKLTWSNSFRNLYNYDGVYLFGKFRDNPEEGFHHIFWADTADAHTVGEGYSLEVLNGGRGLWIYRTTEGSGPAEVSLRLKWALAGNTDFPVKADELEKGNIKYGLQGLEMVYVPTAPFYAGDGVSANAFSSPALGVFPSEYDIIGTNSNFTYSANGSESAASHAARAADRYNQGQFLASSRHDWCGTAFPAYWTVDFKTARRILYFGVSGVFGTTYAAAPAGTWYLEGSADNRNWVDVWHGGPEYWGESSESYPVSRTIRVDRPGAYRYYRIRVDAPRNAGVWNNIRISNVAMTDTDLSSVYTEGPVLINGISNPLPPAYPTGVRSFLAMKYELTQEQYITFLNTLSRPAQYERTIGGYLDKLAPGEYVFGDDRHRPSARNGIVLQERAENNGLPYIFACDLNGNNLSNGADDGQTIACNYLTPADLLAYAEWSGLRPLSELEYEKMCRGYYPSLPQGGEFAWEGTGRMLTTGLGAAGTDHESAQGTRPNVNAGGRLDGPVRGSIFTREGNRKEAGISFWGVSNLSGNLAEIYCNAGMYGRQLDRTVSGTGELQENGNCRVLETAWPREPDAYGIRGGSYVSPDAELAVSDRSGAVGYFSTLSERKPTVGLRLGVTLEPERLTSVLTLESGRKSGQRIPYDTLCGGAVYTIRGDLPHGDGAVYQFTWMVSRDEGASWTTVPNSNSRDLEIAGLQEEIPPMVAVRLLYKRFFYSSTAIGESGVVGLVVGHGYRVNRLRDTMQPCLAAKGFEVRTPLPAKFSWYCMDTRSTLKATRETHSSSYYQESTADLRINGRLDGGEYRIELLVEQAGGCEQRQELQVLVHPWTSAPWEGDEFFHIDANHSDLDLRQIKNIWGGPDKQSWSVTSAMPGALKIDASSGELHGMSQTMCNIRVNLVCADFPDRVYSKSIKEDFRDWYFLEPGAPRTLTLLPGVYRMECKGSQGGSHKEGGVGGLGGHVWGELELNYVQTFYIYVGRQPYNPTTGGYNGGAGSQEATLSAGGAGATDIRLTGGTWDDRTSLQSRIMVAGGGGSGGHTGKGGAGGGLVGGDGSNNSGSFGRGGSQTAAGYSANASLPAGLGRGGVGYLHGGGGGGGYYGGGGGGTNGSANRCAHGGGGGSGYISGYPGCSVHPSGLTFKNAGMTSGTCTGNGYVRITLVQ